MEPSGGAPGSFPRSVAVVGLGLIGGSIALRLREVGARVVGVDTDPAVLVLAQQRAAIESGSINLDIVGGADLVIVATPLAQVAQVVIAAARVMRAGALLTDVGSVKAPVVAAVHASLPPGVRYVGGHPMAGSERQGMAAADPALLDGRPFVLTPTARTAPDAVAAMREVITAMRMRPVVLDPAQHDELVAQASHLPYLVSLALERAIADDARAVGGPAMADMTRVAGSPAGMWAEILRANREPIVRALARFEAELDQVRRQVEEGAVTR
jgi:prephenate dehydrogenase